MKILCSSPTYNEFGEDASEMIADIAGSSAKDGPLWEGSISMHEMQTFNIHLHPVSFYLSSFNIVNFLSLSLI